MALLPLLAALLLPHLTSPFFLPIFSTVAPLRTHPDAASTPPWTGRTGLAEAEFMNSNPSSPDVSTNLLECPLTLWDTENIDLAAARESAAALPPCPAELTVPPGTSDELSYLRTNKDSIRTQLRDSGAVWLRGFKTSQSIAGFRSVYEALDMLPCLDPLHSSGLRKFASERDAVYEEVNKPSLRGHYIGLHSESTTKRTAAYAAFVCFQRATEGEGGRFLVADGAKILAEIDEEVLKKIYEKKVGARGEGGGASGAFDGRS